MNRIEAINQLNLDKKRRENAVWEQWFATESSGNVTSARLQKRTEDIRQIQNWYDDAVFRINNTQIKEIPLTKTQASQNEQEGLLGQQTTRPQNTTKNQQQTQSQQLGRQVPQSRIGAQKITSNDSILKGAENLPENKPINLGREARKRNVDGIQSPENRRNEPSLVQQAHEQNRSDQIRQTSIEQLQQLFDGFEDINPEEYLESKIEEIKDVLRKHEIEAKEFLQELPGRDHYEKLQSIIRESRNVSYSFPLFIIATAVLVDVIEYINLLPGAGLITLIILSIIKYTTLVPILFITTFGNAGFVSRIIMRKLLARAFIRKGYFFIISPLIEFIPFLGAFWPGTLLFTLWLVNAKTTAGLILVELAKIAEGVDDLPENRDVS